MGFQIHGKTVGQEKWSYTDVSRSFFLFTSSISGSNPLLLPDIFFPPDH